MLAMVRYRAPLLIAIAVACYVGRFALPYIINDQLVTFGRLGNTTVMALLLKYGADVNGRGIQNLTPLMAAAKAGNLDGVTFLIDHGADVSANNGSESVLMYATGSGDANVVRVLLTHRAEVNWHSDFGASALQRAKEDHNDYIAYLLLSYGAQD